MLEEDYLNNNGRGGFETRPYNFDDPRLKELNVYSSQLIRENIIPKLTKEINTSKRYAPLRQVYYSLILASWFKSRNQGKDNQYARLIDRQDLTNLTSIEPWSKDTYFNAYQKSFKDGEYNIQEPIYTPYGQTIRSYFSGGIANLAPAIAPRGAVQQTDENGSRVLVESAARELSASQAAKLAYAEARGTANSDRLSVTTGQPQSLDALKEELRPKARAALTGLVPDPDLDALVDNLLDAIVQAHLVGQGKQGAYTDREIAEKAQILAGRMDELGLDKELARNMRRVLMEAGVAGFWERFKKAPKEPPAAAQAESGGAATANKGQRVVALNPKVSRAHFTMSKVIEVGEQGKWFINRPVGFSTERPVYNMAPFTDKDRIDWSEAEEYLAQDREELQEVAATISEEEHAEIGTEEVLHMITTRMDEILTDALGIQSIQSNSFYFRFRKWLSGKNIRLPFIRPVYYLGGKWFDHLDSSVKTIEDGRYIIELSRADLGDRPDVALIYFDQTNKTFRILRLNGVSIELAKLGVFYKGDPENNVITHDGAYSDQAYPNSPKKLWADHVKSRPPRIFFDKSTNQYKLEDGSSLTVPRILGSNFEDARPYLSDLPARQADVEQKEETSVANGGTSEEAASARPGEGSGNMYSPGKRGDTINSDQAIPTQPTLRTSRISRRSLLKIGVLTGAAAVAGKGLFTMYQKSSDKEDAFSLAVSSKDDAVAKYYETTKGLSQYDEKKACWEWPITNESGYWKAAPLITEQRGNYIGVAAGFQNYAYIAAMKSARERDPSFRAFIVDIDPIPIEVVHPFRGASIMCARNRLEFLVWISSRRLDSMPADAEVAKMSVNDLRTYLRQHSIKDNWVIRQAWEKIGSMFPEPMRRKIESYYQIRFPNDYWSMEGNRYDPDIGGEFWERMNNPYSLIGSEDNFRNIQWVWSTGRFKGIVGDFSGKGLAGVGKAIKDVLKTGVGVFYVSNVLTYLNETQRETFIQTVRNLPFADIAKVIRSSDPNEPLVLSPQTFISQLEKMREPSREKAAMNGSALGVTVSAIEPGRDLPVSSPTIPLESEKPGGIDFRSLPIVTQAIGNLRINMDTQAISRLRSADVSRELEDIQQMVDAGISPSGERMKEYVQASSVQGSLDIEKVISCIADILRSEEERCCQTEAVLKDILVVLESARSSQELKEIFVGKI